MKYSELIKLYKEGSLDDEQKEMVVNDIERHEAISEYLFEADSLFEELSLKGDENAAHGRKEDEETDSSDEEADMFVKTVRRSVRKAFIKAGIVIGTVVIAVVLFIIFELPKVVDKFYYSPTQVEGTNGKSLETNKITVDMSVYTELFYPGYYRTDVWAQGNGYGDYDINVINNIYYNDRYKNVGGKITKGKLTLYDDSAWRRAYYSDFAFEAAGVYSVVQHGYINDELYKSNLEEVKAFNDNEVYYAFVTFDKVKTYSELVDWSTKNEVYPTWFGLCIKDDDVYRTPDSLVGFNLIVSSCEISFDEEKYPCLSAFSCAKYEDKEDFINEETMTNHAMSVLNYYKDSEWFRKMTNDDDEACLEMLDECIDNIKEEGINTYGIMVAANKEDIMRISGLENVCYMSIHKIQ